MIVDPDFLDHWRTRMLVDALGGDEMAPMCLMRLWAHCQVRRADRFEMPAAGLKAQCRFTGDADTFEAALIQGKYIERHGDEIEVLGWAEQNASLLAAWENGGKGGRPRKEPKRNPLVTEREPMGNPTVTHGEPSANPTKTHGEPIREEKRREEEKYPPAARVPRASRKCPEQFVVTDDLREWASEKAPGVDLNRETDAFRDHTFRTAITDWDGAWRNWMRKARPAKPPPEAAVETFQQRAARERVAQMSPRLAARAPATQHDFEVIDGTAKLLA